MKKSLFILLAILPVLLFIPKSCNKTEEVVQKIRVNPEFAQYIRAYTTGVISKNSVIRIEMIEDLVTPEYYGTKVEQDLFKIIPYVPGETYWVNRNTVEFRPSMKLPSGTDFQVDFDLDELLDVPNEFEAFSFNFSTIKQNFSSGKTEMKAVKKTDLTKQQISGTVLTADDASEVEVKGLIVAKQKGDDLDVEWEHTSPREHHYLVKNVSRSDKASEVKIAFNGDALGASRDQEIEVEIPALGDFKIMDMEVVHEPEQYVRIQFSDPLSSMQNLDGLITIDDVDNLQFDIEDQEIHAYIPYRLSGEKTVNIFPGIKNINGYKMMAGDAVELLFEGIKPNVKIVESGVILPTSNERLYYPFEAVNLKSVDVFIKKIYQNNILQFLQLNDINGNSEMMRVSSEVAHQKVDLDKMGDVNLHEWNRFNLDLSQIIDVDPGAIYQVELRFKQQYNVYGCPESDGQELTTLALPEEEEWNEDSWQSYDYWYDDNYWSYSDGYDYRERDNPCHNSYYRYKSLKTNVLASDIGIVAKAGSDKTMHIFLNNLKSTDPLTGSTIEFYNFQQQLLGKTFSDSKGMAELRLKEKPFVIIVKNGKQRGYLKLRDGESLSLSKFDVSGATIQKDVKGFIYAERGVWRPGDSIYVNFMIEDRDNVLPKGHPVSFQLIDPKGNVVDQRTTSKNLNGLYDFRTSTMMESPTGNYTAQVQIGNRTFTKNLKIETVKPNRLKVALDFEGGLLKKNDPNQLGKLKVRWLHGADAGNLRAKIDLIVNRKHTSFTDFNDYVFDDPIKDFGAEEQTVFDAIVDENGYAEFKPDISIGSAAPGMLTANFVTKVFEKGGGFSIDRASIAYSPYESYVGISVPEGELDRGTLVTDEDVNIKVATLDESGNKISRKNLEVRAYKLEWRWWWDSYDNDLASYIAQSSTVPVLSSTINSSNGEANIKFHVKKPDWGRYYIQVTDPESGHSTGKIVYFDWPYWQRAERTSIENVSMLSFNTDKEVYTSGDMVKISFPSPSNGKAIITLESGTKVVDKFLINTTKGETQYQFKVTGEHSPNVFIHVTLLQPHNSTLNDMPIRMYGVAPISVENPGSHLNPVITTSDHFKPESIASINVKEQDGKAMTYTLAVVDDGLLDLTNFQTPNPWNHFYAREALGVRSWDMYDHVMGAFGVEMNRILAVGGDGSGRSKKPTKANRFKPMVRFVGPFYLPAGANKTHKIDIPNYVGSVRVMVVAGQDRKYGSGEKTVPVKSPVMVLGTLPRVLGPQEKVFLPVNVFAMEKGVKNVQVQIKTNGLIKVMGSKNKSISFHKPGDEVVDFGLMVGSEIGIAKIEIIATSGSHVAKHEIELDVRTPNPIVADVKEMVIQPGESWTPNVNFTGVKGTNSASIELSSFPPLNLGQRLKYLVRYPHGCIEQTTSSVFPQLALDQLIELDQDYRRTIATNIKAGLDRLRLFQTADGGFGYWPGDRENSEWGTNYAGHFMLEAAKKGYVIPSGLKSKWIKYQSNQAKRYVYSKYHNSDLVQAYRLYTLALAGSPELGAMNRLRESQALSLQAKWRLAAAYQIIGQSEVAQQLIKHAKKSVTPYRELSYSYGSNIRDEAMILETLVLLNNQTAAAGLAKSLADDLNNDQWMSTQTTAYSLLAIGKFLGENNAEKDMNFSFSYGGKQIVSKKTRLPMYQFKSDKAGKTSIQNKGNGVIYAKVVTEGSPLIGDKSAASNHVSMTVKYMTTSGENLDPTEIIQGTDFLAQITVTNPGTRRHLEEMTLNQIFPSGWEIHNQRMDNFASTLTNSSYDYQDIRDDRVYTYFDINSNISKTYTVKLNASYLGRFYLPTLECEAMYDNTISARIPGMWVEVVREKTVADNQQ